MIDPNDAQSTGLLAGISAALLGLFRWLLGRQVKRVDDLEKWQKEITESQGEFKQVKASVSEMKAQINDIHHHLISGRHGND